MKLQYKLSVILICFTAGASALRCWECDNAKSQQHCLAIGQMVLCDPQTQDTCQITLRHGGWGDYPLIEKSCKQLAACGNNHVQDSHDASVFFEENTQCTMKPPSSVCRCCCNTDGCNQNVLFCEGPLGGLPCPALDTPRNGYMRCRGGNMPQSECSFSCKKGYRLMGSAISRCNLFSQRVDEAPTCRKIRIRCHALNEQLHGSYSCNRGVKHRSRCSFTCDEGYKLNGARMLECIQDHDGDMFGTWSRPQPECRLPQCMRQSLPNGLITCTNRFLVGTTCSFQCVSPYRLVPSATTSNTCRNNEQWSRPTPCCSLPCPPFALMDFIVVMDSSSSVGQENWDKMKIFIRLFLSDFSVRDDATHFAVIRYNAVVDTSTQILLNDFPNSLDGVLEAFDRIPYDGSGTRTGNAINYTASTLLRVGNRPNARDVVLLITDGASQDDVTIPSNILHASGPLVFVLPVAPPGGGRLDLDEINTIAGNPNNVITDALEGGFDALDEDFALRISSLLCDIPCQ